MQNQALYAVSFDARGEKMFVVLYVSFVSFANRYAGNNKGLITVIDTSSLAVRNLVFYKSVPHSTGP